MEESSDEYEVNGWAIATSFVFPLLWKSRGVRVTETAIFTTKAEYECHVFTSLSPKKTKGGSKVPEIKRRKKINLKLDELEYRYTRHSMKRGMNLWGVQRHIGYRGTILSETGGCRVLRDLSNFGSDEETIAMEGKIKSQQKNTTLCIQRFVPPKDNVVYTALLKRERPKYPNRNVGVTFDITAENFGRSYFFPKTMMFEDVDGSELSHHKVAIITRNRARVASLAIAHHIENTHDIFFTELELEFLYDHQFKNELVVCGVKRCQYITVREMWRWPVSEASMVEFMKAPRVVDTFGLDTTENKVSSVHIKHHQLHNKHRIINPDNPNKYAGGYASSGEENESIGSDHGSIASSETENKVDFQLEEKNVDVSSLQRSVTPDHRNQGGEISSKTLTSPELSRRSLNQRQFTVPRLRPQSAGSHSTSSLKMRTAHRPTFDPNQISHNPLRSAKSMPILFKKQIHTSGREAPAFIPSGVNKTSGGRGITLDSAFSDLKSLNPSASGSGDRWAAKKFKGLVDGWKDTRMQPIPASEKAFDNIKVKRVGVDDLHIKMSMLLRIAHEKNAKLQAEIKRWVARNEKDVAALSELEQICTQTQSRLRRLEEKHKREAEKWLSENSKLTDLVSRLTKELKQAKDNLAEERLIFQDKTMECKELRDQLDNALARENSYLARLAVYEDAGTDESKLRNALLALRGEHQRLQEAHKVLVSEHEEVNEQYEELRMENEKKDAFRNHLYKLLADRSTAGVKEPERKGGGFGSYPVPGKKNVERAVKMLCDGKFRPPPKRIRKGRNKAIRQLRHLREIRLKSEEYFHVKEVTVDAPSVFRQLRAALSGGRTLFGKKDP